MLPRLDRTAVLALPTHWAHDAPDTANGRPCKGDRSEQPGACVDQYRPSGPKPTPGPSVLRAQVLAALLAALADARQGGGRAPEAPRLDDATLSPEGAPPEALTDPPVAAVPTAAMRPVSLSMYRAAGEAVAVYSTGLREEREHVAKGTGADPDRAAAEAARRARTKVRRYCASHALTRQVTLTYRGEGNHDRQKALRHVEDFTGRLRKWRKGQAFAYVAVMEWHPGGHGIHVHCLLGFYVPKDVLRRCWGKGFVDVRKIRTKRGGRDSARRAAQYAAKYVAKDDDPNRPAEAHRYTLGRGFAVVPAVARVWSFAEAERMAEFVCSGVVAWSWSSADDEDWRGPPVRLWMMSG